MMKEEAEKSTRRADRSERLTREYMKLHEQGIEIMQKHGLLGKFSEQNTNFTDKTVARVSPGRDVRAFLTGPGSSSRDNQNNE